MKEEKYFNFPVQLLCGLIHDKKNVLDNIFDYAIYKHSIKLDSGSDLEKIKAALKYFEVTSGDEINTLTNGEELYDSIPENSPFTGISKDVWFDFYKNEKTDFENATLLAFLAIKSILGGRDSYKKLDNLYLLSRMDGLVKSVNDYSELSKEVFKYSNHYTVRKLKTELRNNWGLKEYSRYTKGFYVSFTMPLDELVFQAEKRKKSTKERYYQKQLKEAVEKAHLRLNNEIK